MTSDEVKKIQDKKDQQIANNTRRAKEYVMEFVGCLYENDEMEWETKMLLWNKGVKTPQFKIDSFYRYQKKYETDKEKAERTTDERKTSKEKFEKFKERFFKEKGFTTKVKQLKAVDVLCDYIFNSNDEEKKQLIQKRYGYQVGANGEIDEVLKKQCDDKVLTIENILLSNGKLLKMFEGGIKFWDNYRWREINLKSVVNAVIDFYKQYFDPNNYADWLMDHEVLERWSKSTPYWLRNTDVEIKEHETKYWTNYTINQVVGGVHDLDDRTGKRRTMPILFNPKGIERNENEVEYFGNEPIKHDDYSLAGFNEDVAIDMAIVRRFETFDRNNKRAKEQLQKELLIELLEHEDVRYFTSLYETTSGDYLDKDGKRKYQNKHIATLINIMEQLLLAMSRPSQRLLLVLKGVKGTGKSSLLELLTYLTYDIVFFGIKFSELYKKGYEFSIANQLVDAVKRNFCLFIDDEINVDVHVETNELKKIINHDRIEQTKKGSHEKVVLKLASFIVSSNYVWTIKDKQGSDRRLKGGVFAGIKRPKEQNAVDDLQRVIAKEEGSIVASYLLAIGMCCIHYQAKPGENLLPEYKYYENEDGSQYINEEVLGRHYEKLFMDIELKESSEGLISEHELVVQINTLFRARYGNEYKKSGGKKVMEELRDYLEISSFDDTKQMGLQCDYQKAKKLIDTYNGSIKNENQHSQLSVQVGNGKFYKGYHGDDVFKDKTKDDPNTDNGGNEKLDDMPF